MTNDNIAQPDGPWLFAMGTRGEFPMLLRVSTQLPGEDAQLGMPMLVLIQWGFTSDDGRMPDDDTLAEMAAFEAALIDSMATGGWGACVAVMTFGGVREWRCYTQDAERFQEGLNDALAGQPHRPLKFHVLEDPDWSGLKELAGPLG